MQVDNAIGYQAAAEIVKATGFMSYALSTKGVVSDEFEDDFEARVGGDGRSLEPGQS